MPAPSTQSESKSNSTTPAVLVLGDLDRAEMSPVVVWLQEHVIPSTHTAFVRDLAGAMTAFGTNEFPDLIVVLQSWSSEYSTADVNNLLSFAPLARVVVCYGAWCESDGRNYNLWPLSVRVPIWATVSRLEREWGLIQNPGGQSPLPWSASREEVFAADHSPIPNWPEKKSILVDSPDPEYRRFLCEFLINEGHTIVATDPTILLVDADPWGPARSEILQSLQARNPQADPYVLVSLAIPTEFAEFQQLGITNVIHKLGFRHGSFNTRVSSDPSRRQG